jgi:hypothetical protein
MENVLVTIGDSHLQLLTIGGIQATWNASQCRRERQVVEKEAKSLMAKCKTQSGKPVAKGFQRLPGLATAYRRRTERRDAEGADCKWGAK